MARLIVRTLAKTRQWTRRHARNDFPTAPSRVSKAVERFENELDELRTRANATIDGTNAWNAFDTLAQTRHPQAAYTLARAFTRNQHLCLPVRPSMAVTEHFVHAILQAPRPAAQYALALMAGHCAHLETNKQYRQALSTLGPTTRAVRIVQRQIERLHKPIRKGRLNGRRVEYYYEQINDHLRALGELGPSGLNALRSIAAWREPWYDSKGERFKGTFPRQYVAERALDALAWYPHDNGVPFMLNALKHNNDWRCRGAAVALHHWSTDDELCQRHAVLARVRRVTRYLHPAVTHWPGKQLPADAPETTWEGLSDLNLALLRACAGRTSIDLEKPGELEAFGKLIRHISQEPQSDSRRAMYHLIAQNPASHKRLLDPRTLRLQTKQLAAQRPERVKA